MEIKEMVQYGDRMVKARWIEVEKININNDVPS